MAWQADRYDRFDRQRRPLAVSELVDRVVDHHRIAADLREAKLFADWTELVGERIGKHTRPQSLYDRVLVVEVATSTWLHELRLLRPKIVSDLLDTLGLPRFFDDIRFVLAKETRRGAPPPPIRPTTRRHKPPKRLEPVAATGRARETIVDEVQQIADPELRELVARVRIENDR